MARMFSSYPAFSPSVITPWSSPAIKQDLTSVLNDYLTHGKIEDILFESYLNE